MNTPDELQKMRRYGELAERAYSTGRCLFTDFLSMDEIDLLLQCKTEIDYAGVTLFGGAEGCERAVARFGDGGADFPIVCIKAEPVQQKFADPLTHRDLLGALMHLNIAREKIGDIFLHENIGYLFCIESVAPVILDELTKARRTKLRCTVCSELPADMTTRTEERVLQIASERMDVLVAAVFKLSREESLALFREKKVFANGRCTENNSGTAKPDSIISVRHYGRFRYLGVLSTSKKGKLNIRIALYV